MFLNARHGIYLFKLCHDPTIAAPMGEVFTKLNALSDVNPLLEIPRVPPTFLNLISTLTSASC